MILSLQERLAVLSLLPDKGDYVTLKVLMKLKLSVGLTDEEIEKWGVRHDVDTKMVYWEENGEAEIPISEVANGIIIDSLRDLEKNKQLTEQYFELYGKFIPTTE
jgi:hypothetical protein